ncbi:MAG: hypothetical protein GF328_10205, partial [Candidatus Latescibacteria bacterium]|nr:hypothetical protein [Candidatus Latescibacterota bacterium]
MIRLDATIQAGLSRARIDVPRSRSDRDPIRGWSEEGVSPCNPPILGHSDAGERPRSPFSVSSRSRTRPTGDPAARSAATDSNPVAAGPSTRRTLSMKISHAPAPLALCLLSTFWMLLLPFQGAGADPWTKTAGPSGGTINAVGAGADVLYAGAWSGLHRSSDDGGSWEPVRGAGLPHDVHVTEIELAGSEVFVGTRDRGLFRSTDGGTSWETVNDGLPALEILEVHARGADLFVLVATSPTNLFRSSNAGDTWEAVATPDVLASFTSYGTTLFGGSANGFGMLRSLDDGATWEEANEGLPFFEFYSAFAVDGTTVYTGSLNSGLYRSTDLGESWETINDGFPAVHRITSLARGADALFAGTRDGGLWRSTNGGDLWEPAEAGFPESWGEFVNDVTAAGEKVFAGTLLYGVVRSLDGGESWSLADGGPVATNVLELVSLGEALLAVDGSDRVASTGDGGGSWSASSDGFPEQTQCFSIAALDPYVFTGTRYEGVFRAEGAGGAWSESNAGFPQYNGTAGLQYREAENLAVHGDRLLAGTGFSTEFINGQFQLTGAGIYISTNAGESWFEANDGYPSTGFNQYGERIYAPVTALESIGGTILAGAYRHGIYRSTDGGESWTEANDGLPFGNAYPDFDRFVRLDADVYGTTASGAAAGVYRSTDDGRSWTRIDETGLPNDRFGTLAADETRLFLGLGWRGSSVSGDGVYVSTDRGVSWEPAGTGLDDTPVLSLHVHGNDLFAGTGGHGVWNLGLGAPA